MFEKITYHYENYHSTVKNIRFDKISNYLTHYFTTNQSKFNE